MLIFTLNFTLKTNMSYNNAIFTIATSSNFQNFPQKPYFLAFFYYFGTSYFGYLNLFRI
jgi:hypothetical protein